MSQTLLSKDEIIKESPQKGLESFIQEFYEDRIAEIKTAKDCLERQNHSLLKELAHKWKGYSAPYGFNLLGQLGAELEVASLNSDLNEAKEILNLVDKYMAIKAQILEEL